MTASHTKIRVSTRVKRTLDRRRRADESYNDFLERVLIDTTDEPADGCDRQSEAESDPVSLHRKRAKIRRKGWTRQFAGDDTDTDDQ